MEQSTRNPLIEGNIMDTLANVEQFLEFIGELILHFQCSGLEFDPEAGPGLGMSIRTAQEALRSEIDKDKGEGVIFSASSKLNKELRERKTADDTGEEESARQPDPTTTKAAGSEAERTIDVLPRNSLIQDAPSDSLSRISDAVSTVMELLSRSGKREYERGNADQHRVLEGMRLLVGSVRDALDYEAARLGSVRI